MTAQEATRTMLLEANIIDTLWREPIATTIYIINQDQLKFTSDKTPYELSKGRPALDGYFKVFGSKCYMNISDDNLGKFNSKSDK